MVERAATRQVLDRHHLHMGIQTWTTDSPRTAQHPLVHKGVVTERSRSSRNPPPARGVQGTCQADGSSSCRSSGSCSRPAHPRRRPQRRPHPHRSPCVAAPQEDARVIGRLVGIGGPVGTAVRHWSGTVLAKGSERRALRTDDDGRFSTTLVAGTYRFTATSPSYDGGQGECSAEGAVRLRSHHTTYVRVVCQLRRAPRERARSGLAPATPPRLRRVVVPSRASRSGLAPATPPRLRRVGASSLGFHVCG